MSVLSGAFARLGAGVLATLLVLVAAGRPPELPSSAAWPWLVTREPALAAAFTRAYGRGDGALAERLASPLYRAQWALLGLSVADRTGLRFGSRSGRTRAAAGLEFRFVGGVRVEGGFTRLLYTVWATAEDGRTATSVWRADTDPGGSVVWLELVWLFSDAAGPPIRVEATEELGDLPLAPEVVARRPVVLLGVRSAHGREGYYALGLPTTARDGPLAGGPGVTGFVGVDADGELRPGTWSYGQPNVLVEYGAPRLPVPTDLAPDLEALRSAYLGTLRCLC